MQRYKDRIQGTTRMNENDGGSFNYRLQSTPGHHKDQGVELSGWYEKENKMGVLGCIIVHVELQGTIMNKLFRIILIPLKNEK